MKMAVKSKKSKDVSENSSQYSTIMRFCTTSDKVLLFFVNFILLVFGLIVILPLINVVAMSFSSPYAIAQGRVWFWPADVTFEGYSVIFANKMIVNGYLNSILYAIGATVLSVFMTMICAYPLTREFKGKGVFVFLLTLTMFFGGGLIPYYLLISKLKLLNSPFVMMIPGALSAWNVIIARTFINGSISNELREAAELDGCNDFSYLFRIVFPLSGALIAVMSLWSIVGSWNGYFNAMIFLNKKTLWPLQLVLREILIRNDISNMTSNINTKDMAMRESLRELLKYSLVIVSTVPMLIIYPFVQKHFVKGIMIGSIKG